MFSFFTTIKQRIYLDHAAATPLGAAAKKSLAATENTFGNPSSIYKEGIEAKKLLSSSRKDIASILSCQPHELYFTGSGTESISLALIGVVSYWHETHGNASYIPQIITSPIEHPAVLATLRSLEQAKKIEVLFLPVAKEGIIEVHKLRTLINEKTILVSLIYASNEIGTIQGVKEAGRIISQFRTAKKEKGGSPLEALYPYFHIDACQASSYLSLDVQSLRADLLTINSSKVYGPKGVALLYKKESVFLTPVTHGGGQERGLRSGTENVSPICAFAAALKESQGMKEEESKRLEKLRDDTIASLQAVVPDVVFYGTFQKGERLPHNINCRIPGISSEEVILRLDAKGIAVSHKSACASNEVTGSHVLIALGESEENARENIRITMGRGTTKADMTTLVEELGKIASKYAQ